MISYNKIYKSPGLARRAASILTARFAFTTNKYHYTPPHQPTGMGSRRKGGGGGVGEVGLGGGGGSR